MATAFHLTTTIVRIKTLYMILLKLIICILMMLTTKYRHRVPKRSVVYVP